MESHILRLGQSLKSHVYGRTVFSVDGHICCRKPESGRSGRHVLHIKSEKTAGMSERSFSVCDFCGHRAHHLSLFPFIFSRKVYCRLSIGDAMSFIRRVDRPSGESLSIEQVTFEFSRGGSILTFIDKFPVLSG